MAINLIAYLSVALAVAISLTTCLAETPAEPWDHSIAKRETHADNTHNYEAQICLRDQPTRPVCVGAILTKTIIITVASVFDVIFDPVRYQCYVGSRVINYGGTVHQVTRIDRHPKYIVGKLDYNVAAIVVVGLIEFTDTCQPIAFPDASFSLVTAVELYVTGWLYGLLSLVLDLLVEVVTLLSDSDCSNALGSVYTARHCCARTCIGNLGAPLVRSDGSKKWLVGLQARSSGCILGILNVLPSLFTDCTNPDILSFVTAVAVVV